MLVAYAKVYLVRVGVPFMPTGPITKKVARAGPRIAALRRLELISASVACFCPPGRDNIEEENQNMDMLDASLWLITGASFVLVALGCWMTRPRDA